MNSRESAQQMQNALKIGADLRNHGKLVKQSGGIHALPPTPVGKGKTNMVYVIIISNPRMIARQRFWKIATWVCGTAYALAKVLEVVLT